MPLPATIAYFDMLVQTTFRTCSSRHYFEFATPPTTQAQLTALADAASALVAVKIKGILSSDCGYLGLYMRYKTGGTDIEAFSSEGADAGDGDPDPLPDEVCAEIQKRTGQVGRDKRGRYFFSGISSAAQADGVLTDGFKPGLAALAAFLGADIAGGTSVLHARHYDRKTNTLIPISQCRPVAVLASRRDRRKPLTLAPY